MSYQPNQPAQTVYPRESNDQSNPNENAFRPTQENIQKPITQQPGSKQEQFGNEGWAPSPQNVPAHVPLGLQYLLNIDHLIIHQKVDLLEAFIGFERNNKYTIKNSQGEKMYYAVEQNDCCTRICCGPIRPFDIKLMDNFKNEVLHFRRDLACQSCCFPCCLQKLEVYGYPGKLLGTVEQTWSIFTADFDIKNAQGETVLKIQGPFCVSRCCADVNFKVVSVDGATEVGKISKKWSGFAREVFTDADFFGVSFPLDLDVNIKAVLIGACFLIDFMVYEHSG